MTAPPRYKPLHPLGTGGMGTVLACEDTERGGVVALKTLTDVDPLALSLFKNEFRSLADLAHPNLVALYELGQHEDKPFFTMEVVDDAVDLLKFVRGTDHASGRTWLSAMGDLDPDATLPPLQHAPEPPPGDLPLPSPLPEGAAARLRDALGQLAEALATLHVHGKIHRDVKPSNVLVEPGGRVVLVDFGLVCSLDGVGGGLREVIAGSVPYMSPEQSIGAEVGPAADWYAFGAVLYELLTGRPPFAGARAAVLAAKRGREVVPPQDVVSGVPEDLGALAVRLLRTKPEERPTGEEVLTVFGRELALQVRGPLVGRDALFARLDGLASEALDRSMAAHLRGPSGHGKSSLAQAWLADRDALVLRSRCYERDGLPYRAIDPLIEGVVDWARGLHPEAVRALVPRYTRQLVGVFPSLERLTPFAEPDHTAEVREDAEENRRRLHVALRELFARAAGAKRMVAFVDDLQWADEESLIALSELRREPDAPVMLWLVAYRDQRLTTRITDLAANAQCLNLDTLSGDDAEALAGRHVSDATLRRAVVAEAGGVPYHLVELAIEAQRTGVAPTLASYLLTRLDSLPEHARTLMRLVALAGKPVGKHVLTHALGMSPTSGFAVLGAARLVQTDGERAWPVHDRVREAVRDALGADQARDLHHRLARGLIREEGLPEDIAHHLIRAGEREAAAQYTRVAAEHAHAQLAIVKEAAMWRQLLDLRPDASDRAATLERLADALLLAGRRLEAGEAGLACASAGGPPKARLTAALSLSQVGDPRGEILLVDELARVRFRLPRTTVGRLVRALWTRLITRLQRWPRRPGEGDDARLWALLDVGIRHLATDSLLSYVVLGEYVRDAFARGNADHLVQAAGIELALCGGEPFVASRSAGADALARRFLHQVSDKGKVYYFWGRTFALAQQGRWRDAAECMAHAQDAFARVPRMMMERRWLGMYESIFAGLRDGPAAQLRKESEVVASARESGDIPVIINTRFAALIQSWLIRDRPSEGRRDADALEAAWPGSDDTQAFYLMFARLQSDAYEHGWHAIGDQIAAGAAITRRSRADAHQGNAAMWLWKKQSYAVAANREVDWPTETDGTVFGDVGKGMNAHLAALGRLRRDDVHGAAELLQRATANLESEGLKTMAQLARWALSFATDDPDLRVRMEAWMAEQEVVDPTKWAAYHNADLGRFWTP